MEKLVIRFYPNSYQIWPLLTVHGVENALSSSYCVVVDAFCFTNSTFVFLFFRSEIATLTEKVRALEIAQVNQRKQQAIIMAALAAEKLKKQKNNEFQSDSNLTYYSGNQGSLDPNAGDQPNNLLNHGGAFLQNCFEIVW